MIEIDKIDLSIIRKGGNEGIMKTYMSLACKVGAYNRVLNELLDLSIPRGDIFLLFGPVDADLYEATVITLYLSNSTNQRLKPKLENEARVGTRIVSYAYEIEGWQATQKEGLLGDTIHLYIIGSVNRTRETPSIEPLQKSNYCISLLSAR